jgi:NADH-quinone oxidoreductase subunit N
MNSTPDVLRILPEVILTITGVVVMMVEATLKRETNRAPLGWLSIAGIAAAMWASLLQFQMAPGMAFHYVVQTDAFSGFFHILICGISLVVCLIALDSFPSKAENEGEFFALVLFGTVGMVLMSSAVELLLIFIALEISSISTYILAGFRKHAAKGPESSLKYFLLGSFATAFFLYGVALVFGATGTTNIHEIAERLSQTTTPSLAVIALGMMLIGIGFKVSAAPFQVWTPDVYEGAPSPVVALMSTAPKAAAFAVLVRVAYGIFPLLHMQWSTLLWLMAALSMTVGNLGALRQQNVKRMLAYSSIAHAGYLLVAFAALSNEAIAAASFYAVAYATMNVGVFAIVSHVGGYDERVNSVGDYRGLAYKSPLLGAVLAFFLISLIGIPFTGGFFGKFYVFTAAIHGGAIWLAIIGLLNSGVAAYYYLRLLTTAYTKRSEESAKLIVAPVSFSLALALVLTAGTTLVLGIMPGRVLGSARAAAQTYAVDAPVNAQQNSVAAPLEAKR